ncbi:MAG: hypothetical protein JW946_04105 [Candidatus Omnitrophica bacterium]|nr:hypothetical protein [Candidatus Omnitrophota bacterium]
MLKAFELYLLTFIPIFVAVDAIGKGHGTDCAVLAGLLGWQPETCDSDAFVKLLDGLTKSYAIKKASTRFRKTMAVILLVMFSCFLFAEIGQEIGLLKIKPSIESWSTPQTHNK